jgi:hypothetical protein
MVATDVHLPSPVILALARKDDGLGNDGGGEAPHAR